MYVFSFEKLESWQMARKLAVSIYKVTQKFPDSEKFQLTRQLRKAATSVSSNLAEGSGRITPRDQAHFSVMSYASLMEVLNHLILSMDLEFITNEDLNLLREKIVPLSIKINNLKKAQLARVV